MLICSNGVRIIEDESELPYLTGTILYLDLETTSKDPTLDSLNPWHNCWIGGICIAVDDGPVYYVPVAHAHGRNIECREWLAFIFENVKTWVNHNIKYDAHVIANDFGLFFTGSMVDTVVMAKLLVSDRLSYSLDSLMKDWLPNEPGKLGNTLTPYLVNNKDFGQIPIDVLGEYGGGDIYANRTLYWFIRENMPADCLTLMETEIKVTSILFDIERFGMRTQPNMLKAMNIHYITKMIDLEKKLYEVTGYNMRPHVNDDCYDLLCNKYGLPVLKWTNEDEDTASFSKDALYAYLSVPGAPVDVIEMLMEYRTMNTFRSLFLETYLRLHVDGVLHPDINQTVRTGRMSVRRPNSQQLNKNAKRLIIPNPGCSFLSIDYSQIEFRLIVHYIGNEAAIKAYNDNPDTDFHTWVAEMCGIPRKPAKNVNFCMGYGGGRAKLISMLKKEPTLVDDLKAKIEASGVSQEAMLSVFEIAATHRAQEVYETYHSTLPTLKSTSRAAEMVARKRGYVYNLFGRRRHLDRNRCHIAFNALNQSTAADILKSRLPHVNKICKRLGLNIAALVHDEVLFHGPTEVINSCVPEIIECLEQPDVKLSIPLRCSYGISDKSWFNAGEQELKLPLERCHWHRKP